MSKQIDALIKKYKKQMSEYRKLVAQAEERGLENLNFEDTETYGVYLGKAELLEEIIKDLTIVKM